VFDGSGHTWRLLAAVIPAMAAVAVGVSRYVDYWHHASDVAAGMGH
jgi:membrane-associated phospholipid phosphatase